jgi:hypothetical protein
MTPTSGRLKWFLCGGLLLALVPAASGYEQTVTHGPLTARLEIKAQPESPTTPAGKVEVALSGELLVTLTVEGPTPLEVAPGEPFTTSPGWKVRAAGTPAQTESGTSRSRWSQVFRLVPSQKDDVPLQVNPLRVRPAEAADWTELTWKPVPVRVTTEVARADLAELRPGPPPEELPPVPPWYRPFLIAGLGLAVVSLLVAGWRLRRRGGPAAVRVTPEQWALQELGRIEEREPAEGGDAEHFHTLVSDVVRRYLELRFDLPASRRTTAEFLAAMRQAPLLTAEQQALLRRFLERCDLAKFAPVRPSPGECREASAMAREFVEGCTARSPGEKMP